MRKESTLLAFTGISQDGGFVFDCLVFPSYADADIKVISYSEGEAVIAIDSSTSIQTVAELIAGLFNDESKFFNLDCVILNYSNISLKIDKNTGRKNIISMLMKQITNLPFQKSNTPVDTTVTTSIYERNLPIRKSDDDELYYWLNVTDFEFDKFSDYNKIIFKTNNPFIPILISNFENGIISIDCVAGANILDFLAILQHFFSPYSNMYGIKGIDISVNEFSIRVDTSNVDNIFYLYEKCCSMSYALHEKEKQEYNNSSKYLRYKIKQQKKSYRKGIVIEKIRKFYGSKDFSITTKNKKLKWEKIKNLYSKDFHYEILIDYTILWAQYMEYLIEIHNKKLSDICDITSHFSNIYGISGYTHSESLIILCSVWKYGEELRILHNSKYN